MPPIFSATQEKKCAFERHVTDTRLQRSAAPGIGGYIQYYSVPFRPRPQIVVDVSLELFTALTSRREIFSRVAKHRATVQVPLVTTMPSGVIFRYPTFTKIVWGIRITDGLATAGHDDDTVVPSLGKRMRMTHLTLLPPTVTRRGWSSCASYVLLVSLDEPELRSLSSVPYRHADVEGFLFAIPAPAISEFLRACRRTGRILGSRSLPCTTSHRTQSIPTLQSCTRARYLFL